VILPERYRFCAACGTPVRRPEPAASPLRVTSVFRESFRIYFRHAHHLVPSALILAVFVLFLEVAWSLIFHDALGLGFVSAIGLATATPLLYFLSQATAVQEVADAHEGRRHTSLRETIALLRPRRGAVIRGALAMAGILWGITAILVVPSVAAPEGAIVIPLLCIAAVLAIEIFLISQVLFFMPALLLEGRGVIAAARRSRQLARGRRWRILGTFLLVIVLTNLATVGIKYALIGIFGSEVPPFREVFVGNPEGPRAIEEFVRDAVAEALIVPFGVVVAIHLYFRLTKLQAAAD
jgi:hypothetical protein